MIIDWGYMLMNETGLKESGIDYVKGLRQFVGNRQIYERYLSDYRSDRHCDDAMAAFDRGDMGETLRQVHALKGLSSTLGMTDLFNACSEMVVRLRDDKTNLYVLSYEMDQVREAHERALAAVSELISA
jgi:HPt (histidine-containing phosphotransfer) domain-containing protein